MADIAASDGCSPLFVACHEGNFECVNLLLSSGATVDLLSADGASPLHIASQNGADSRGSAPTVT